MGFLFAKDARAEVTVRNNSQDTVWVAVALVYKTDNIGNKSSYIHGGWTVRPGQTVTIANETKLVSVWLHISDQVYNNRETFSVKSTSAFTVIDLPRNSRTMLCEVPRSTGLATRSAGSSDTTSYDFTGRKVARRDLPRNQLFFKNWKRCRQGNPVTGNP